MTNTWITGPWIWDTTRFGGFWRPPAGFAGLDCRTLAEQGTRGGTPGLGVFVSDSVAPATIENRSDYQLLGRGNWYDIKPTAKEAARIPRRKDFAPAGDDLCGLILSILTDGADPDGGDGPKPIVPTVEGRVELNLGQRHAERFRFGKWYSGIVRDLLRKQFAATWAVNRTLARKQLDFECQKYNLDGADDWKQLVPAALVADVPGRLPHDTTIADDFTRADGSVIGNLLSWTQTDVVSGTWSTVSNQANGASAGGATFHLARAESDLSSADHYAQVAVVALPGSAYYGAVCRFAPATDTGYLTLLTTVSNKLEIWKSIAATITSLSSVAASVTLPSTIKGSSNGSTLKSYQGGVELASITDTGVSTGTRTGMIYYTINSQGDDFEAADLGGGGGGIVYTQIERGTRGLLRGLWTGRG